MKVIGIEIVRRASYETDAGSFKGKIVLEGEGGKQELVLSAKTMSAVFKLVREEASVTARRNAGDTSSAIEEAVHSTLLLESAGYPSLPSEL